MPFEDDTLFYARFTPSPGATARRDAPPSQTYHHEEHLRDNQALQVKLADRIQDLGNRIASAEQLLRDAVFEKRVLENRLQILAYEASIQQRAFSPARTLPQEMLGEIFLHLLESLAQVDPCGVCQYDAAVGVFGVASVSRAWRAAAINTPGLWSNIEFAFYTLSNSRTSNIWLAYLQTHLARSRAHPVKLNITTCNPEYIALTQGRIALNAILGALPRCVRFSLCADSFGTGEQYLPLQFQQPTPLLEEFLLLQEMNDNEDDEPHAQLAEYAHFLPHAPRLRNLTVDGGMLHCVTFARFPALSSLHVDSHFKQVDPVSLFRLLSLCDQVERLTVGPECRDLDAAQLAALAASPPSVLTLPKLTHLVLNGSIALFCDIASMISCPALRDLEINGCYSGGPEELLVMESLICTSITALDLFSFEPDSSGALVALLRALPHLSRLTVSCMSLFAADLAQLCAPDERTGQWIVPRLQEINFDSILKYDGGAVLQLLKFVDVRTIAGTSEHDDSPVRPLRKFNVFHRDTIRTVPVWVQGTISRFLSRVVGDGATPAESRQ